MLILLFVWLTAGIALTLLGTGKSRGTAGLPLAYFLGLSLIHVPGALFTYDDEDLYLMGFWTRLGFEQTVIGMVALVIGVMIARYTASPSAAIQEESSRLPALTVRDVAVLDRLALLYLGIGFFVNFLLMRLIGDIPSATAITSPLGSLIIIGACLRLWVARESKDQSKFWSTIALLPMLPFVTLIQGGFLGYGTYWVLGIVSFAVAQSRRRLLYLVFAPVIFFVGLSLFVNYMPARDEIRDLVWRDQAGISDRISRVVDMFDNFEWLDVSNSRHRDALSRLNQNWLVGAAVARLASGEVEYAAGATLGTVLMGLIPRVIWPDKPAVGGGGTVVHDFTGIEFAEGTSVGAGQVFEFYVNFGMFGVIGGFLLYGWLLGKMDLRIIEFLHRGDQVRFVFWFLICLSLLQPGGNLLEVVVGAAASAITGYGVGHFLAPMRVTYPRVETVHD